MMRYSPLVFSFVTLALLLATGLPGHGAAQAIHLEAEDAQLTGCTVQTAEPGFTGTGYVGDLTETGAKIVWDIPHASAGLYEVRIRCRLPAGNKGYELVINGSKTSGMFTSAAKGFVTIPAGKAELTEGANTVEINRGWGYYQIDSLDFVPATAPAPLLKPSGVLCDPQATPGARALIKTLLREYGTATLSGQYNQSDCAYVLETTGKTPAILGNDLIEYTPSRVEHGSKPQGMTERAIAAAKAGQIITLVWHWNAPSGLRDTAEQPWYKGFYTAATTFDIRDTMDNPAGDNYKLLLRDIDTIAVQLKAYSDAGVPVLWRPLHEAEGGWFWWGAHGPEPYKKLWRLVYERLTAFHHLHNLIWVSSSGTNPQWYPGDTMVDIVGIDEYPANVADPCVQDWETLLKQYGARKPLALTEFGGVPDIAKMQRYGVRWCYFVSWNGFEKKMPAAEIKRLYADPAVRNK